MPPALTGPMLLARAKYNLSKKYHLVGLVDRMPEFETLVAKKLGWRSLNIRDDSKVTRMRPRVDAVCGPTRNLVLRGNGLDVQLYQFAQKLFSERVDQHLLDHSKQRN